MDKYYTPDIEDLFVGYEFEFAPSNDENVYNWKAGILQSPGANEYILDRLKKGRLRTPYLTTEQIEKEGWERTENKFLNERGIEQFKKRHMFLNYDPSDKGLLIINLDFSRETTRPMGYPDDSSFKGRCPSINEFRKICKLMGI